MKHKKLFLTMSMGTQRYYLRLVVRRTVQIPRLQVQKNLQKKQQRLAL